jgi:ATP-binding cassette, subfamily B, bacterial PglK
MLKINKIWKTFNFTQKKNISFLVLMMIVGMFLELVGISSIVPLILAIVDKESFLSNLSFLTNFFSFIDVNSKNLIWYYLFLITFIFLFKFIYLSYLSWKLNKFTFDLNSYLSKTLLYKYLLKDILFHVNKNSSELISNIIIESNKFAQQVVGPALRLFSEIVVFFGITLLLLYLEPKGTLIALGILAFISILFIIIFSPFLEKWGGIRISNEKLRIKYAQEGIDGIRDIKLANMENHFTNKFEEPNFLALRVQAKHTTLLEIPRYGIEFFGLVLIMALIVFLILNNKSNTEILVTIGIFSAATFRILPSINKVLVAFQNLKFGLPVIDKIYNELNKIDDDNKNHFKKNIKPIFNESIRLKNISFKYIDRNYYTLENINVDIFKGKSLGIYGDSGSGKSTLISIVCGLIKPLNGEVLVDNVNIENNIKNWMKNVSLVSQRVFLFDDTIRNNIILGDEKISKNELETILATSKLTHFINSLPKKDQTRIGERGIMLSGGQVQRIGIARALIKKPQLLIFDESTNALDKDTENNLINDVYDLKNNLTKIFVSHKMSILERCDNILKIEDKKITVLK